MIKLLVANRLLHASKSLIITSRVTSMIALVFPQKCLPVD